MKPTMTGRALVLLMLPLLAFAGDVPPRAGAAAVLIPASGAGGRLSIWCSGAVTAESDGWAQGQPGRCQFRMEWIDVDDPLHVATCVWSVDLPAGRFLLGAEKDGEQLMFTLTKLGQEAPLLRSGAYGIEHGQRVDGHAQF
jgi:hypothetical protein